MFERWVRACMLKCHYYLYIAQTIHMSRYIVRAMRFSRLHKACKRVQREEQACVRVCQPVVSAFSFNASIRKLSTKMNYRL